MLYKAFRFTVSFVAWMTISLFAQALLGPSGLPLTLFAIVAYYSLTALRNASN